MYYEKVFKMLQAKKVDYLIAGGMAVNLHGVPRFTKDLDIMVNVSTQNLTRLAAALKALGFRPQVPVGLDVFLNPQNWKKWRVEKGMLALSLFHPKNPYEVIDLLTGIPVSFEKAKRKRRRIVAGGLRLNLVSIDDLIRMKRVAGREQDLSDIEALKKVKALKRRMK